MSELFDGSIGLEKPNRAAVPEGKKVKPPKVTKAALAQLSQPTAGEEIVEYYLRGEPWLCLAPLKLREDVQNVPNAKLPLFHESIERDPALWVVARRLWGLQPALTSVSCDPDDLKIWSKPDLARGLGISQAVLRDRLDAIAGLWRASSCPADGELPSALRNDGLGAAHGVEPSALRNNGPVKGSADGIGRLDDVGPDVSQRLLLPSQKDLVDRLLAKGFKASMFELDAAGPRKVEVLKELEWFVGRVDEFAFLLNGAGTADIARAALLKALEMRRADEESLQGGVNKKSDLAYRDSLQERYQALMEQLQELSPRFFENRGHTLRSCLEEVIAGVQRYYASGNAQTVDGIFTATEVEILVRRSEQSIGPEGDQPTQYRPGLVAYLNEAKGRLFDPSYRSRFNQDVLARVDRGWQEAMRKVLADEDVPPDLLADGPHGEYPPLGAGLADGIKAGPADGIRAGPADGLLPSALRFSGGVGSTNDGEGVMEDV